MRKFVKNNFGQSNWVAILSLIVAIVSAILTGVNFHKDNKRTELHEETQIAKTFSEVLDLLGGYEGTIWIDTHPASFKEFLKVELAQRKIENEILVKWFNHAKALEIKACCLAKKGNYEQALNILNAVIKSKPDRHTTYNRRGSVFLEKRDLGPAINDFNTALRKNPNSAEAYCLRGIAWYLKGDVSKAIDDFNEALNKDQNYVHAYYNRGAAESRRGNLDIAKKDFSRTIELYPLYHRAYSNRGIIWQKQGEYNKALSDFNKALGILPYCSIYNNNKAWLLATCPNEKYRNGILAVTIARKALEDGDSIYFMDTLAAAFAETGNFNDAIEIQKKIIAQLEKEGDKHGVLKKFRDRLNLYKKNLPYRES